MSISDGLKKLTLAAIGAGAVTCEKTAEVVEQLVKKGETTVGQGKVMNSELKHNVKESMEHQKDIVKEAAEKAKSEIDSKRTMREHYSSMTVEQTAAEVADDAAKAAKEIIDVVSRLSKEQISLVKSAIDSLNQSEDNAVDIGETDAEPDAEEEEEEEEEEEDVSETEEKSDFSETEEDYDCE